MHTPGDTSRWVVRRCAKGGVNTLPLLETLAAAQKATTPASFAYTMKTRLRVGHREVQREVAKEQGSAVKGQQSGFGMAGGPTVESTDP